MSANKLSQKISYCEAKSLTYFRKKGNYNTLPGSRGVHHTNMTEQVLHLKRMGLDSASIFSHINYFYDSSLSSQIPANINITSNIPKVFFQEFDFKTVASTKGKQLMLRPGQKLIVPLQDTLRKYCKPAALIFNSCLGTGAKSKTFLSENKHCKLVGCDEDIRCVREIKLCLIYVSSSQALSSVSDIDKREVLFSAVRTLLTCWTHH